MAAVSVIGSINIDISMLVEKLPEAGETIIAHQVNSLPGGKGANQAIACQRLGGRTRLIGRVGKDDYGKAMKSFLRNEGVDVSAVVEDSTLPTGTAYVAVDRSSENSIIVAPGANCGWSEPELNSLSFRSGEFVLAQFEVPIEVSLYAFRRAHSAGAITLLNPAPMIRHDFKILEYTDIIVLNQLELGQLMNKKIDLSEDALMESATGLVTKGIKVVVVTLGAAGAIVVSSNTVSRLQGRRVQPIDTTGAGDCFIGALASALSRGITLSNAATFANTAASICVTRRGAASAMPMLSEIVGD